MAFSITKSPPPRIMLGIVFQGISHEKYGPFRVVVPMKNMMVFYTYVSLPEATHDANDPWVNFPSPDAAARDVKAWAAVFLVPPDALGKAG